MAYTGGQVQRVRSGLANHADRDRLAPVQAHGGALFRRSRGDAGDVVDADRHAVHCADHHLAELGGTLQVGGGGDVELALRTLDAAGRHLEIGAAQRVFHVLHGKPVSRQLVRVEPDAHGKFALAEDRHVGSAGCRLQHRLDQLVGHFGQLQRGMRVRTHGQEHHREGIRLDLGDHRFVNTLRQALAHPRDLVTHVRRRRIGVARQGKADRDQAALLAADGRDDVHTLDTGERILQYLGDLPLDHFTGGTPKTRLHTDHGLVDLRVLAHRQAVERHRADQHDQQGEHRREDRAADRGFSELHGVAPLGAA